MPSLKHRIAPFLVHLLTASGAFWALLAAIAVFYEDWPAMFLWLGVALIVDGLDGPLARKLEVKSRLPHWQGEVLDLVIDFVTYVFVPALAIVSLVPGLLGVLLAGVIVVSGALYFANDGMKTEDKSFRGFPGCWNMVALALFALDPPLWAIILIVLVCAVLSFAPVVFVHPVRTIRFRPLTLAVMLAWIVAAGFAIAHDLAPPDWVKFTLGATSIYLFSIGFLMQVGGLSRAR